MAVLRFQSFNPFKHLVAATIILLLVHSQFIHISWGGPIGYCSVFFVAVRDVWHKLVGSRLVPGTWGGGSRWGPICSLFVGNRMLELE
jgi:hypothetical protein